MTLSVIIVNYNVRCFLRQCLLSVYASAENLPGGVEAIEVFVVDNASSDGSVEYLRTHFPAERYPSLHIIANTQNMGFGRANNQAVDQARGRYILFLNPDTILTEHTLADCIAFGDAHEDMGALGTWMQHSNGSFALESRRGTPTPWVSFCKMSGLASLFPHSRLFGRYYMRYLDHQEAAPVEIISGAYMMARRDAIVEVGAFDEDFFMHGEDIDLSLRLYRSGRTNYYIPSPILHYKGKSTRKTDYRYVRTFYRAMLIFFRKHYPHYRFGLALPIQAAILAKAAMTFVRGQVGKFAHAILPARKNVSQHQLYIGRNVSAMRRIADANGLDIDYIEADETSLPQAALPPDGDHDYIHIIYDLSSFSRDYVLRAFRSSDHRRYIGTFTPEADLLVLGSKTYELNRETP